MDEWRILTWNVQGSRGFDLDFIRTHIVERGATIVVVQEIQRRQAQRLADVLRMEHQWARKHTPLPRFSEGLAIFARDPISSWSVEVITSAAPWSWRRRIVVGATVTSADGVPIRFLNVHLSAHAAADRRARELATVAAMNARARLDVIAGDFNADLNTMPNAAGPGHHDASPAGPPTCWAPGPRVGRPPATRLDGIFVNEPWVYGPASTPTTDLDRWAKVSDHLPVDVNVSRRDWSRR